MTKPFSVSFKVKAKHGIIFSYAKEKNLSIRKLAEKVGVSYATLLGIINFKWFPKEKNSETVNKLCKFFNCSVGDIFPKEVVEIISNDTEIARLLQDEQVITRDVDFISIGAGSREVLGIGTYEIDGIILEREIIEGVRNFLDDPNNRLDSEELEVVKMRYGIGFEEEFKLDRIASEIGKSRERVRQILYEAFKKMKHPIRLRKLRALYDPEEK